MSGSAAQPASDLYRAVWRWHFYAGLLSLPFVAGLAITGTLNLWGNEIDALIYRSLKQVSVPAGASKVTLTAMADAALAGHPGEVVKFNTPATASDSAEITIASADQSLVAVYVNPYSAQVLGSLPGVLDPDLATSGATIMVTIRRLHSLKYFGTFGRAIIETVAGWVILLVGTGIYLWWPRNRSGRVLTIRGTPKGRLFWRDTHANIGIFVAIFIVFFAASGMPYTQFWGGKSFDWINGVSFAYPSGLYVDVPTSGQRPEDKTRGAISLDKAAAVFDALKLDSGYSITMPYMPGGVFTGANISDDLSRHRVVHIDEYTGRPLLDVPFAHFGPLARGIEVAFNTHHGRQFGLTNQIVMLAACIAIVVFVVSAAVMWWKRRPSGSLGVPPLPSDRRAFKGILVILALGGILFPLVGVTFLIMLTLDFALFRMRRA